MVCVRVLSPTSAPREPINLHLLCSARCPESHILAPREHTRTRYPTAPASCPCHLRSYYRLPQAARESFAAQDVEFIAVETIAGVIDSVSNGDATLGVVPVENSTYGIVLETYDSLRGEALGDTVTICGEHTISIRHCLLARRGTQISDVTEVWSHPQVCMPRVFSIVPTRYTNSCYSSRLSVSARDGFLGPCLVHHGALPRRRLLPLRCYFIRQLAKPKDSQLSAPQYVPTSTPRLKSFSQD